MRETAPLIEAAQLLCQGTDMVVVLDASDRLAGVVTKGDVVAQISHCQGASCVTSTSVVMTREAEICKLPEGLHEVWDRMRGLRLKNFPVVDEGHRPIGVLNARDVLDMLLREAEDEESLLTDYVVGIGYR